MTGPEDAAAVLWRGGVHYLTLRAPLERLQEPSASEVAAAFAALAASGSARQAEAIVAALLWRPDWGGPLADAVARCGDPAVRQELMYGYAAACYLQQHWYPLLELYGFAAALPDLYTVELGLPPVSAEAFAAKWNLHVLAWRRGAETGANFAAEYDRIIHHLEGEWIVEGRLKMGVRTRK